MRARMRALTTLVSALALALALAGCWLLDIPEEPYGEGKPIPYFTPMLVSVPDSLVLSQDSMAGVTANYIDMVNQVADYRPYYHSPAAERDSAHATWEHDGMEVRLYYDEDGEGRHWTVRLDGLSLLWGIMFSDYRFLEIRSSRDSTGGEFVVFDYLRKRYDVLTRWTWFRFCDRLMVSRELFGQERRVRLDVISDPDLSGELHVYWLDGEDYVLRFKARWDTGGAGAWWSYDDRGNPVGEGRWY